MSAKVLDLSSRRLLPLVSYSQYFPQVFTTLLPVGVRVNDGGEASEVESRGRGDFTGCKYSRYIMLPPGGTDQ